ncbi:MAG: pyridoxal-phosphate dependent enzyme, partial [Actinomycetota bacterium]|nr:pyridoxal-phosphate dependent enzyme [Actinomycetota bacterium]
PHAAVTDEEAFQAARLLARREGILAGVSSGAVLHAALTNAAREHSAEKTVAALLADRRERYISSALFDAATDR